MKLKQITQIADIERAQLSEDLLDELIGGCHWIDQVGTRHIYDADNLINHDFKKFNYKCTDELIQIAKLCEDCNCSYFRLI